jgi:hypothetical protein
VAKGAIIETSEYKGRPIMGLEELANLIALIACLGILGVVWKIYKKFHLKWTLVLFSAFVYLLVIRIGITFNITPIYEHSRALTASNMVLIFIGFAMFYHQLAAFGDKARSRLAKAAKDVTEREDAVEIRESAADEREEGE